MLLTGLARLGRDAELRDVKDTVVANLSLAFNWGRKGDGGAEQGKYPSQWINGALWGKRAEALAEYLVSGQQVVVTLKDPHIETYTNRDGVKTPKLCAEVIEIELAGGAPQQRAAAPAPRAPARPPAPPPRPDARSPTPSSFDDMEDIPF